MFLSGYVVAFVIGVVVGFLFAANMVPAALTNQPEQMSRSRL